MTQRASVRDVATLAGVSISSVSRVLNESGYVSRSLRRRVEEAVKELAYVPDFTARHMRTGHSRTIGYLLPNIANPLLAAHFSKVEQLMQAAGYSVLVGSSEKESRDRQLLEFFESRRIEGVIVSPTSEYADRKDSPFLSCPLPIVVVDRDMAPERDSVLLDHHGAIRQAMDYLLSMGHRRIALYASGTELRPGREKLAGYRESLASAGIAFDPALIHLSTSWIESSHAAMTNMLRLPQRPTALIALAPRLLAGALRVAREAGLDVPRDLSVIGMGTTQSLELMYPPATALRYNYEQSAQAIVRLMLERVQGQAPAQPRRVVVPWDLVLGSSCAPPPRGPA